ncbi:TIGR02117 family protein [Sphingobacterium chuzhouense]|uniref:TIGR02117 family protein n=1 Tax=Sphingobacterium chuzhouense TaxID=1742264 RepID=A0ABR7XW73_9SPHI|nr:TIGR02117 family protein [Sphingobacterium chuzhouense]MBD1423305.1 TIGR02117 family protein [Sphingobacterium chuzhouense]
MTFIKSTAKVLAKIILGVIAFVVLYFLVEAILSRIPGYTTKRRDQEQPKDIAIYVMSNGVHTDIVLPVKNEIIDWSAVFPFENTRARNPNQHYIGIGWGDKGFYLNTPEWKDLKLSTALVAVLGMGETALHITYYYRVLENDRCYKVMIDENQYNIIKNYILESLDQDLSGNPVYIETAAQYGQHDAFYEAKGAYHLFFSCNTWTNKMLKKANLPAGIWTVFDKGILRHYRDLR